MVILKTKDLARLILKTKDLGLAVQAIAASSPSHLLERSKKIYTLILKIKDLADGDPANKGLSKFDLENKGLRTGRPGFVALIHLRNFCFAGML